MYCTCSMKTSYQIGIYCYFDFDLVEKLRSFLYAKRKASINAIKYVQTYTNIRTLSPKCRFAVAKVRNYLHTCK